MTRSPMLLEKLKRLVRGIVLWRWVRRERQQAEPIPRPLRTHGCANFWYDHGCPDEIGAEINVAMTSGRTAVFRLSKIEPATGVDWSWYDFDFVRYLPSPNTAVSEPGPVPSASLRLPITQEPRPGSL